MANTDAPWYMDAPVTVKKRRKKGAKIVREDDVEGKYIEAREAEGKLVLKVKVLGRPGYPDRLVLGDYHDAKAMLIAHMMNLLCAGKDAQRVFDAIDFDWLTQELIAKAVSWTELKKTADSPFQPKQKTIIPMLRERGFKVDIVHG